MVDSDAGFLLSRVIYTCR